MRATSSTCSATGASNRATEAVPSSSSISRTRCRRGPGGSPRSSAWRRASLAARGSSSASATTSSSTRRSRRSGTSSRSPESSTGATRSRRRATPSPVSTATGRMSSPSFAGWSRPSAASSRSRTSTAPTPATAISRAAACGAGGATPGPTRRLPASAPSSTRPASTSSSELPGGRMIDGLLLLPLTKIEDERGWFYELRRESLLPRRTVQTNVSFSRRGVIRGLHYHERGQDDLFACLSGAARVVVLDRATDEAFSVDIGDENPTAVYVPGRHAHGFEALTDCLFTYHVTEEYDPASPDEHTLPWDDARVRHLWSTQSPILSRQDSLAS